MHIIKKDKNKKLKISENKYKIGDLKSTKNPKLDKNEYQGIIRLLKEINILQYHSGFNNENKKTKFIKNIFTKKNDSKPLK